MEWITQILTKHTKEDGTVDVEAARKEIDKEFPQHAVPKDQYNNLSEQLTEANKTLKTLEEKTKDNPDVQEELAGLKAKAETLEQENKDLKITSQVTAALQDAGAKDVEYAKFKLGELELTKDGQVKDLENKVKELKTTIPDYFKAEEPGDKKNPPGYTPVDTKLSGGKPPKTYSREEIEKMTPNEINENWEAIGASLGGNE
ncbi:scaffolding protein [Listeria monocytogenes]|uniref:phage scaffolding protein n=1 Tax=Listeria monocytogenes TaxID=1639 RepID=UPI000F2384FD|nr:phage scaffolding protein [Listeria monocytogenes]EAG1758611.1 scaffolding protein [Listeria monocytogenes]MCN73772.1 scaffolding protein [Listeria monocytogenes]TYU88932.1 scaffolding protein [Listeria monocytogenes]